MSKEFCHLVEFHRDKTVETTLLRPGTEPRRRRGRFDGDQTIHLEGGEPIHVEVHGPHLIYLDGDPHRRILDDGTIVDYPRTLTARFERPRALLLLHEDGTLTHEVVTRGTAVAERGRYDLHRGLAHLDSWGHPRGILLLPRGSLRLGREEYQRLPAEPLNG